MATSKTTKPTKPTRNAIMRLSDDDHTRLKVLSAKSGVSLQRMMEEGINLYLRDKGEKPLKARTK